MGNVRLDLRGLERLKRNARALHGTHHVPLGELFTPAFMSSCSRFHSFQALVAASPFNVRTAEDFKAIPDADRDAFIRQNTRFASWQDMVRAASVEWTKQRLLA